MVVVFTEVDPMPRLAQCRHRIFNKIEEHVQLKTHAVVGPYIESASVTVERDYRASADRGNSFDVTRKEVYIL